MWVFGYGSLVWNPGFETVESVIARLPGYRRSFCMRSVHHRGTPEVPGLVLALDRAPDAACSGLALRAAPERAEAVLAYLRERELVSAAYHETWLELDLDDGRTVEAVTYVVDPDHAQYCRDLDLEEQAQIIARAQGGRGPNSEYLINTEEHLRALGLGDGDLDWLVRRVREIRG